MPLVWAHAEFIKLVASRALGRPFDALQVVRERYRGLCPASHQVFWSQRLPTGSLKAGQAFGICLPAQAIVHWSVDGWHAIIDTATRDTGLGVQLADLPVGNLGAGQWIDFTFWWSDRERWEGQDFRVDIV